MRFKLRNTQSRNYIKESIQIANKHKNMFITVDLGGWLYSLGKKIQMVDLNT